jgi:hypothetical protein
MTAEIINVSGEPDIDGEPKTYDLQIDREGYTYWKLGRTVKSLARRFAREPNTTLITVRQIWRHNTERQAENHEVKLFRRHKGDMPFIGKMGPLIGGGNTEVYSHDVARGEPSPKTFKVLRINPSGWRDTLTCYVDFDPYSRWPTQYNWVPALFCPQFDAVLVTERSDAAKITVCSLDYLADYLNRRHTVDARLSRRVAEGAYEQGQRVWSYADAYREVGPASASGWLPKPRY